MTLHGSSPLLEYIDISKDCRVQAYDLKRPLNLPLGDYAHMKRILEEEERNEKIDRNAWKRDEWRNGEDAGMRTAISEQHLRLVVGLCVLEFGAITRHHWATACWQTFTHRPAKSSVN